MKKLKELRVKPFLCRIILFLTLLMLVSSTLFAQAELTGTIIVTVKDDQEAVLPGVQLTLASAARTLTGTTTQIGKYKFVLVPAATYELSAELEGFRTVTMSDIRVNFGETYYYDIIMKIGTLEETITVTATPQIDVTLTTTKEMIDPEVIENLPLRDRNFKDVLKLLPGVNDDKVRGSRSTNTGYRIDGVNNVDPFYSDIAIVFSQEAIDRFELIPGGFQAKYGEFSGGIVNVATKSGANKLAGHVGFYFRNDNFVSKPPIIFAGQLLDVAPDMRRFYEFALGGPIIKDKVLFFATSEYRTGKLGSIFSERTMDSEIYMGSFKLDYIQSEDDLWHFFIAANVETIENIVLDRFSAPEFNAIEKNRKYILSASQQHIFNENLFVESQFSWLYVRNAHERTDPEAHWTLYTYTPTGTYTSGRYHSYDDYSRARYRLAENLSYFRSNHNIVAGFEIGRMTTDGSGQSGPTLFDLRPLGSPMAWHYYFEPRRYNHVKSTEAAIYLQDSIVLNDRFTVDAGVRVEYQSLVGNTDVAPRLGFSYDVTGDRKTKLYANAGIFYDKLYGYHYYWKTATGGAQYTVYNPVGLLADGEEILEAMFRYYPLGEQKTPYNFTWSAGFERLLPYDLKFAFNYTDKTLKNQLLTYREDLPGILGFAFRSDGSGKYRGAEFILSKRFTHRFQSLISYTISRARGDGNTLYQFYTAVMMPPKDSIEDFDRTHNFKALGTVLLPWDVMLAANYYYISGFPYSIVTGAQIGIYYIGDRNSQRMPSAQSLDFSIRKTFLLDGYKLSVVFEGYNITNHSNVTGVSTAPANHGEPSAIDISRTFQLGFTFDF